MRETQREIERERVKERVRAKWQKRQHMILIINKGDVGWPIIVYCEQSNNKKVPSATATNQCIGIQNIECIAFRV